MALATNKIKRNIMDISVTGQLAEHQGLLLETIDLGGSTAIEVGEAETAINNGVSNTFYNLDNVPTTTKTKFGVPKTTSELKNTSTYDTSWEDNWGIAEGEIPTVLLTKDAPTGPAITFPEEENIYFFNTADELITELDMGQLSPIKDTDIYPVRITTNITTDTFESITLGTTEESVDCLLSSVEDPFESLEQITIPFTNDDIVTIYLKLATDEVQTVGAASLELLVVGNLAT